MGQHKSNPLSLSQRDNPFNRSKVLDRYGQPIAEGDLIMVANNETHPHYVVRKIQGGTDPRIPAGYVVVEAQMVAPILTQLGTPQPNLILVMKQKTTGDAGDAAEEQQQQSEQRTAGGIILPGSES